MFWHAWMDTWTLLWSKRRNSSMDNCRLSVGIALFAGTMVSAARRPSVLKVYFWVLVLTFVSDSITQCCTFQPRSERRFEDKTYKSSIALPRSNPPQPYIFLIHFARSSVTARHCFFSFLSALTASCARRWSSRRSSSIKGWPKQNDSAQDPQSAFFPDTVP